jgi:protein-S-isoprenylcysteine O-methyltransferase Ste14
VIPSQRIVDLAIGISILGWATAGTWSNLGQRPVAVLLVTSLLHFTVGILFLVRWRAVVQGSLQTCLVAIPAVLVGGWVFRFAPIYWNLPSQILFATGGGLAILSFAFLGRCFAILPAIRGTVTRGPFAFIRHPAYLGELAMVVASVLAVPLHWGQPVVLIVASILFVVRIHVEERLLRTGDAYQSYCRTVRWRLVPFVW